MRTYKLETTATTGGAGVATSTDRFAEIVNGRVQSVDVAVLAGTAPATQDLTVRITDVDGGPVTNILVRTDTATPEGRYYPRAQAHDTTGAGMTFDGTRAVPVEIPVPATYVEVVVAQSNNGVRYTILITVDQDKP